MNLGEKFKNFQLGKVRLGPGWLNLQIEFKPDDKDAAWELYVEMLTRIVIQPLPAETGDEKAALDSVYSLFPTTRKFCGSTVARRSSLARSQFRPESDRTPLPRNGTEKCWPTPSMTRLSDASFEEN